jgi:hypothetical protein
MAVYVNNIVINAGEYFSQPLTIIDSGGSSPVNLTGYAASSAIRKHPESSIKSADFTVDITSATKGKITLSLASTITSTIKEGRYVYDVLLISDANFKSIAVEGSVLVRSGITS